jgi:hypothetical protein
MDLRPMAKWSRSEFSVKILSPIILFVAAFIAGGCKPAPEAAHWVDPNTLQQGPILHEKLSDDQIARITHLQKVFAEVDSSPLEKWIEDFSRDRDPDREIAIYEGMATPFQSFIAKHTLSIQGKKDAYQIVLLRSGASEEETLSHMKLKELTEANAREILSEYSAKPEPILIEEK